MVSTAYPSDDDFSSSLDQDILLGFLFSHKIALIVELLRRRDLQVPRRITESDLRNRVRHLLESDEITLGDIQEILNELEGWGRQQIYLYKFTGGVTLRNQWLDEDWVTNHFQQFGLSDIFNVTRPIATPDEPTLISIEYSVFNQRLRFIWVQKRTKIERDEANDPPPQEFTFGNNSTYERMIFHAFREITVRGVIAFDWNIKSNDAMITIRKLRGTNYAEVRDRIFKEIADYLPVSDFQLQSISSVITRLDQNNDVIRRSLEYKTLNNDGRLSVSSGNQNDVYDDEVLEGARVGVIDSVTGLSGTLKWRVNDHKHITLELYGKRAHDQRIGIGAQELEENIRYVLQRIRTYCV